MLAPDPPVGPGVPADLAELSVALLEPDAWRRPTAEEVLARLEGRTPSRTPTPERAEEGCFVGRAVELAALEAALELGSSSAELLGAHRAPLARRPRGLPARPHDPALALRGGGLGALHLPHPLVRALRQLGRPEELAGLVLPALAEADERADVYTSAHLRGGLAAELWLHRDEPEEALRQMARSEPLVQNPIHLLTRFLLRYGQAQVDLYRGDGEAALERLRLWPLVVGLTVIDAAPMVEVLAPEAAARAALATARVAPGWRRARLTALARGLAGLLAHRTRGAWERGCVHALRAGIASVEGARTVAADRFARAAAEFARADMRLLELASRAWAGELAGGAAGEEQAARALEGIAAAGVRRPERLVALYAPC